MLTDRNKRKVKKVVKGLSKASKTHASQARTLKGLLKNGLKILYQLSMLPWQMLKLLLGKLKTLISLTLGKFKFLLFWNKGQKSQAKTSKRKLPKKPKSNLGRNTKRVKK